MKAFGEAASTRKPVSSKTPPIPARGGHAPVKRFYEIRSGLHRRVNGALLSSKVKATSETTTLTWTLDYDGPRSPLTILRPSLEDATGGQTEVIVYAEGKNGWAHSRELRSPTQPGKYMSRKDWFVTVEKDKQISGTITISIPEARDFFREQWPDQFDGTIAKLHVQLIHKPTDRGEAHGFDAWTGELHSRVLEVRSEERPAGPLTLSLSGDCRRVKVTNTSKRKLTVCREQMRLSVSGKTAPVPMYPKPIAPARPVTLEPGANVTWHLVTKGTQLFLHGVCRGGVSLLEREHRIKIIYEDEALGRFESNTVVYRFK
jgi:hypothetical protein